MMIVLALAWTWIGLLILLNLFYLYDLVVWIYAIGEKVLLFQLLKKSFLLP